MPARRKTPQFTAARKRHKVQQANLPPQPFPPYTTKAEFVKALEGTAGILARIAGNLKRDRATVRRLLERPDWQDMREAWEEERQTGTDLAEVTVHEALNQRVDLVLAAKTAQWVLTKLRKETFGDETKINHTGKIQTDLSLDDLDLPLETKKVLLEAAERKAAAEKAEREAKGVYE